MTWKTGLLGLMLAAAAFDASAQSRDTRLMISEPVQGYAFYNRPGASLDEHDEAYRDCFVATNIRPNGSAPSQGLAFAVIWGGVLQAIGASAAENCMIAKGWRVFQLPEEEGRALSRLSDEEFTTRFAPMVGAATPPGLMARQWDNQAAHPARYHTPSRPRAPSRHQLSVRSFGLKNFPLQLRTYDEAAGAPLTGKRGVALDRIGAPAAGNAIIIVRAVGRHMSFARTPETGGNAVFFISGNREGAWQAFEVPAGRWRISGTGWVNHCLGSAAFDVAPGEVVYAGTFDLVGETLGPVLNAADVPGRLTADLAGRLRVAAYQNGSTVPCAYGSGIYPLEIPGAPFEPGYRWGSRAVLATPAP
ncbi:hypothetical protein ASC65_00150 [Brevundimonas sp. Root1279]|nr:hypothetical protein ASC65_00150 [Brevundimonas sp. Root1279]